MIHTTGGNDHHSHRLTTYLPISLKTNILALIVHKNMHTTPLTYKSSVL